MADAVLVHVVTVRASAGVRRCSESVVSAGQAAVDIAVRAGGTGLMAV